jgi:hypothetical protein
MKNIYNHANLPPACLQRKERKTQLNIYPLYVSWRWFEVTVGLFGTRKIFCLYINTNVI